VTSALVQTIHAHALAGLSRGILSLLSAQLDSAAQLLRAQHIVHILQERILPDMDLLDKRVPISTRIYVVNVVLELICSDKAKSSTGWGIAFLGKWYQEGGFWKTCIEKALREFVSSLFISNSMDGDISELIHMDERSLQLPGKKLLNGLIHSQLSVLKISAYHFSGFLYR
jgi:hypothetical protein